MRKRKIIVFVLSIVFCFMIYGVGNVLSYARYKDKDYIEIESLLYENKYLKNELNLLNGMNINMSIGRVIYRDFSSFYEELVVFGKDIEEGSAVLSSEGLVGVVKSVVGSKGYVSLLPSTPISVMIGDNYGTLKGDKIELVSKYAEIKKGDIVYTSGLGYLPAKLYVGVVSNVDSDGLGIILKVDLCKIDNLNYVYFIKGEGV